MAGRFDISVKNRPEESSRHFPSGLHYLLLARQFYHALFLVECCSVLEDILIPFLKERFFILQHLRYSDVLICIFNLFAPSVLSYLPNNDLKKSVTVSITDLTVFPSFDRKLSSLSSSGASVSINERL